MALPSINSDQIAIDPISGVFFFKNSNGSLISSSLNLLQASNTLVTTEDSIQIAGNVVISGDLTVNGDTTIIKTEVLTVEDKNIELGNVASPTNTLADGGGITLKGTTNKTFNWSNSTSSWTSSENIDLASGKVLKINGAEVLSPNAYIGSSAKWTNARTITLAGDLTGSVSIDGSASVTLTATVATNSVALGTDTTGDYVSSLVAGTGISLANNSGETATPTITLNAVIDNLTDVTLTAPANGDFFRYNGSVWINDAINLSTDTIGDYVDHLSAGTGITITNNSGEASVPTISIPQSIATSANVIFNQVTAALVGAVTGNVTGNVVGNVVGNVTGNVTGDLTGNSNGVHTGNVTGTASNALVWTNQRKITLDGDVTGNVFIDGSANVIITTTIVSNSVELGTDTTGQYVANLVSGTGITITDNSGEGMTPVIKVADSYTTNMVSNIANSAASVSTYADGVGNTAYSNAVTYINNRTLDDLSGVTLSNVATNNVLLYNGSAWINNGFNTAKLSDVLTNNVQNGQTLLWDSGLGKWVNSILPEQPQGSTISVTRGNGSTNDFTIYHGFNTADVVVTVRSKITNEVIQTRWSTTDSLGAYSEDYVTVEFTTTPALNEMQIAVYGAIQSTAVVITGRLDNLSGDVMIGSVSSGDALFYNGSKWINRKASLATDMGDVLITGSATGQFLKFDGTKWINSSISTINNLDDVGDVTITSAANKDFLMYNGTAWVDQPITLGTDTTGSYVASLVAGTGVTLTNNSGEGATPTVTVDTTVIQARVTNVTDTEIGYLDGVTSAIQTQINNKLDSSTAGTTYAPLASPTFTGSVSGVTKTMVGLGNVDNTADTAKPISTDQQTALGLKANIASPTFTGTPTLPTGTIATTQTASNNSTAVATTAYVDAADVLKANLASPTFTGTVTLPANTVTSSMILDGTIVDVDINSSAAIAYSKLSLSNSITTTDLVSGPARGGFNSTLNAQTASYTLQATDLAKLVTIDSASNVNVTVPNILSDGDRIDILRKHATGEVTILEGSGVNVYGTPGYRLRAQWSGATLVKLAANTWVVMGDLKV